MYQSYKDRIYWHYEVSNFVDVSDRLRELRGLIKNDAVDQEDVNIEVYEAVRELRRAYNKKIRALAREIRSLHKQLKGGDKNE